MESPSDVVVHALYLLEACDRFREAQLDALRREVAIGIELCERGEVAEVDIEEIIREARRQLETSGLDQKCATLAATPNIGRRRNVPGLVTTPRPDAPRGPRR